MENQLPNRIHQKEPLPSLEEIKTFIDSSKTVKTFESLLKYLNSNYDFSEEIVSGGKKNGVMIRYRKSGKTLVNIFPEKKALAIVLVYGKKEVEVFEQEKTSFNPLLVNIFDNTEQLHDGRWMLIPLQDDSYLEDIKRMITIKKKPKNK